MTKVDIENRNSFVMALSMAYRKSRSAWGWDFDSICYLQDIARVIKGDELNHYVTFAKDGLKKIVYTSANNRRITTTLGRYVRRQLKCRNENLTDKRLTQLSEFVFSYQLPIEELIHIHSGPELTEVYDRAAGCSSCMTGGDAELMTMLEENPDKVSVIVLGDDMARALLWTADCGTRLLDRIYPSSGGHIDALQRWAEKNGYLYRDGNGSGFYGWDGRNKKVEAHNKNNFYVTMERPSNDLYPFLDSLFFATLQGRNRIRVSCNPGNGEYELQHTDGNLDDANRCSDCNERVGDYGRVVEYEHYCDTCFSERFFDCEYCSDISNRDYAYCIEDVGEDWCEYCRDNHAVSCEECGSYISTEGAVRAEDSEGYYCNDCASEELKECEVCSELFAEEIKDNLCDGCGTDCETCGDRVPEEDIENGMCEDCGEKCDECGDRFDPDELEDGVCEECAEELVETEG